MFYQWNRNIGWPSEDPIGGTWNSTGAAATTWETTNDPCPDGWRVPTLDQLSKLTEIAKVSKTWETDYFGIGVKGYLLTDNVTSATLFLPAAGSSNGDGTLINVGAYGGYRSSTPNSTNAYLLNFYSGYFGTGNYDRAHGMSVRCVWDEQLRIEN